MKSKEEVIKDILNEFTRWSRDDINRIQYEWMQQHGMYEIPSLQELAEYIAKQRNLISY